MNGLEHGFRVGFDYNTHLASTIYNMPSAMDHPDVVKCYISKKHQMKMMPGPTPKKQAVVGISTVSG